jgi:hypothetical protein
MKARIKYEKDIATMATRKNIPFGAGSAKDSICIPKTVAAKDNGIKINASSVSLAIAWASAIDLLLSNNDILEFREAEVFCSRSIVFSMASERTL